jgi:hypothetical protein
MAIELVEIRNGTYGSGNSAPSKANELAIYDEGSSFVDQIGEILLMSGLFDDEHIEYDKPDPPTDETYDASSKPWRAASNYRVWGVVDDENERVRAVGFGPNIFRTSSSTNTVSPSGTTPVRVCGTVVVIRLQNGTTLTCEIGNSGIKKATADIAYVTSNGVIIRSVVRRTEDKEAAEPTKYSPIMVAKGNGPYPIVCIGAYSLIASSAYRDAGPMAHNGCVIACYSDENMITTSASSGTVGPSTNTKDYFRFATSAKQSVLAPFAAYGKANGFTFSPYAFWIPVASDVIRTGGWKKVHIDGKNYATDGYWALRDG